MSPPVRVRDLIHTYRSDPVLEINDLSLHPGRVHLAGANGAGKTTLLEILATLKRPERGQIEVGGHRLPDEAGQARADLGFVGHDPSLHPDLTPRQALSLHARLHREPPSRVDEALEAWNLDGPASRPMGQLSFGQRRRADLARALLHDPSIVLLDEPGRGLDRQALGTLERALRRLAPELVLAASPDEAPIECDRRLPLVDGRVQGVPL